MLPVLEDILDLARGTTVSIGLMAPMDFGRFQWEKKMPS